MDRLDRAVATCFDRGIGGAPILVLFLAGCTLSDWSLSDPDVGTDTEAVVVHETFIQAPLPKLDILFVVDGTGSMAEEQAAFATAADTFVERLDTIGLAWQLGVTSTDPADGGALLGEPWILTSADPDPAARFAETVQIGTDRVPPSAGLYAAQLAIEDEAGVNVGFRRADAPLHVVFVSDGDDDSDPWLGNDPAQATVDAFTAEAARTGHAVRASAVVGQQSGQCDGPYGTALPGSRYVAVAEATGGAQVDICATDFSAVADAVESYGVEWPTTFTLQAVPNDGTVVVEVDGARVTDGWSVSTELPALVFDQAPAADAEIAVRYEVGGP